MSDMKKWLSMLGEASTEPTDIESVTPEVLELAPQADVNEAKTLEESLNQIGSTILDTVTAEADVSVAQEQELVEEPAKAVDLGQSILTSKELKKYLDRALSMLVTLKKETGSHDDRVTYLSIVKRLLMQPDPKDLPRVHSQLLWHLADQMHSIAERKRGGNRQFPNWEKYIDIVSKVESMLRDSIKKSGLKLFGSAPNLLKWLKKESDLPELDESPDHSRSEYDANRALGPVEVEHNLVVVVSKPGEETTNKTVKVKGTDDLARAADRARRHFQDQGYRVRDVYPAEESDGLSLAEGAFKNKMFDDAEVMGLDEFTKKYGDEGWVKEFWSNIRGDIGASSQDEPKEMSENVDDKDLENPVTSKRIELAKEAVALFKEQQEPGTPADLYFALRWFLAASPREIKQELERLQSKTKK